MPSQHQRYSGSSDRFDISEFLRNHEQQRGPPLLPHGADFRHQYIDHDHPLAQTSPSTGSMSTWRPDFEQESVYSATTGQSHFRSVFDSSGYAASVVSSPSTVDSDEESDAGILLQAEAGPSHIYPCEFIGYSDCSRKFEDVESWMRHIKDAHLQNILPKESLCWFCDNARFVTQSNQHARLEACFRERMYHIAGHLQADIDTQTLSIRPDFAMLRHLEEHRLISAQVAAEAKRWTEMPPTTMFDDEIPVQQRKARPVPAIIENSAGSGSHRRSRRHGEGQRYHR